jgi:hypothetical protein
MSLQPKRIFVLDSSQICEFMECPQKWYFKYQQRLQPSACSGNVPMDMGTYGHKLLEILYKKEAEGLQRSDALDAAFAYDIDKMTCRCSHGAERHHPESTNCEATGCPCQQFVGIQFPLTSEERERVKDRVFEYSVAEGHGDLPQFRAPSPDFVEVGFSHKLYEDDSRIYVLEGRIDFLGQIAQNIPDGWADHKFQMRQRDLYLQKIQFKNYSLVLKKNIGVVNYIRFAQKFEKGKTFVRKPISFSSLELRYWESQLLPIYHRFENTVSGFLGSCEQWEDPNSTLRRWDACEGKYGYSCDFTPLCEVAYNPGLVQIKMDTDFTKKAAWRPW